MGHDRPQWTDYRNPKWSGSYLIFDGITWAHVLTRTAKSSVSYRVCLRRQLNIDAWLDDYPIVSTSTLLGAKSLAQLELNRRFPGLFPQMELPF
jgi:hypothetical protein